MKTLHWILLLLAFRSNAATITDSFTSAANKDTATAVWNFSLGYVHPTLKVYDYQAPAQAVTSAAFNVSNGSDGAFQNSTYSNFGTVVGTDITVDANVFPILKVSSFQLDSGYTLSSINGPLVIHSLSTVIINGVIECFGDGGSAAVGVNGGTGGSGRCGGFSGGNGGNATQSGSSGLPLAGAVAGGGGGVYNGAAPGAGGGGGGAYVGNDGAPGINSNPATNTGGAGGAGSTGEDHEFSNLSGSPGGGGGSGSNTEGGGGGGGGGGTVVIHAVSGVTLSATGAILAYGGNGGAANSGGGGGGGGGGSVKIFTPVNLHLDSGTPVDVTEGSGAVPSVANAGDGGSGSFGRTWDNSGSFSGSGSESHGSLLISLGTIGYNTGVAETAVSLSFDTGSVSSTYSAISNAPVSPDILLEVAGSDDNFAVDDTGWVGSASLSTLDNKRYVKFKLTLTNPSSSTATVIDSASITYSTNIINSVSSSSTIENFNFESAGCGLVKTINNTSNLTGLLSMLLLMLFPVLIAIKFSTAQALVRK